MARTIERIANWFVQQEMAKTTLLGKSVGKGLEYEMIQKYSIQNVIFRREIYPLFIWKKFSLVEKSQTTQEIQLPTNRDQNCHFEQWMDNHKYHWKSRLPWAATRRPKFWFTDFYY